MSENIQRGRIAMLDTIRGVAVMGILTMNIVSFAMPEAAYMNPAAYGGHDGVDLAIWVFNFVLFDGKMRGLFSLLFGASTLLVIESAAAAGRNPARAHYARMFWLFGFGAAHLWLIWSGDILTHYALVGCIAYFFRKLEPHKLVPIAIILIFFQTVMYLGYPIGIHRLELRAGWAHPPAGGP